MVGLGRVGLPTAARLAEVGHDVVGVDRDPRVRAAARSPHPSEPGLDALLSRVTVMLAEAPIPAEVYALCVGTPLRDDRTADLGDLGDAVEAVASVAPPDALVVIESTVPVGTTDAIALRLRTRLPRILVAACPERVLPGDALRELVENPRVVGGVDADSTAAAAEWLATFVEGPIARTDARTAELVKLVENAARDVGIALANSVAAISTHLGVDPYAVRALVNRHPRVTLERPGIGVGGHCLPVDPWFLIGAAPGEAALLASARAVNDAVPARWLDVVRARAAGRPLGLLGLTYKPDVDDLRHSPALALARALSAEADVIAVDPYVEAVPGLRLAPLEAVLARPVVVRLVDHRAYRDLLVTGEWIDACGGWE